MGSLRIAQMHWGFPPTIGGVETHLTVLLPEYVRRGHEVSLLTGSIEGAKSEDTYQGVAVYRTPLFDLNWLVRRGLEALEKEVAETYRRFFDSARPDVVHVHNMHYFSEIHARILRDMTKRKGIPLILTAHNVWDDLLFLKMARAIKWDHVIAVSHFIKRELVGAGFAEPDITVVHHGIDTEAFQPAGKSERMLEKYPMVRDRRVVFHPARMGMAKGCDVSIKAINLVKERFPDVLLVLAGTKNIIDWELSQQKDIAYFVDLVKMFNLREHVFIDVYSIDEMPAMYSLADVTVYPSSAPEPFGLTMLESLACGKPIVVTETGGMPEVIMDDINGYVIKVKDYESLASRIEYLLSTDTARERLGRTGRQMVMTHYTKEIMTKCNLDVYREVVSGRAEAVMS